MEEENKPIIGISCGDLNGIGLEVIMKTFNDTQMLDLCTPVLFASSKVTSYHRKALNFTEFNYQVINSLDQIHHRKFCLYNSWNDANLRIKAALNGELGKEEQEKPQRALKAAENEFSQAKKASGSGNWLDVCDPMFRVLMAYLELRRAQGKADSFLGRFNDLILGPLKIPFQLIERGCDWVDTLRQPYIPGNNIDGNVNTQRTQTFNVHK